METTLVPNGKGRLVLTGSLGEVIRESAELALTWVKAHAAELGIEPDARGDVLRGCDVHVSTLFALPRPASRSATSVH